MYSTYIKNQLTRDGERWGNKHMTISHDHLT